MSKIRVWHIPQVPGKPFIVEVPDIHSAELVKKALADYDIFQFENRIKPDYCNAQGVEVLVDGDWIDSDVLDPLSFRIRYRSSSSDDVELPISSIDQQGILEWARTRVARAIPERLHLIDLSSVQVVDGKAIINLYGCDISFEEIECLSVQFKTKKISIEVADDGSVAISIALHSPS